jgi:hypothetical protein
VAAGTRPQASAKVAHFYTGNVESAVRYGQRGLELREHVDDAELLAVAYNVLMRLGDRLTVAPHVRQRHDHGFLQPRVVRPPAVQVLDQGKSRRPLALLKKRIEQQRPDGEILGPGDEERAQFDDRFVVLAGLQQRADRLIGMRRRSHRGTACGLGHSPPRLAHHARPQA